VRRKLLIGLGLAALVAVFAIGLSQSSSTSNGGKEAQPAKQSATEVRRALAGAPAPLASLHRQANALLVGDKAAVRARLDSLRGHPVIVNKWASWCGPCRGEFPIFQRVSVQYGKRVAFLGLDAGDNHADAQRFLARFPVSYPSYQDPNERTAFALGASTNFPITLFFDKRGKEAFAHQGGYASQADLVRDIRRYALGAGTA
jgi:cytochrome c biogenesis protein CcmG/thiol:disulfide interchange protein DsbE